MPRAAVLAVVAAVTGCGPMALDRADSMRAVPREPPGVDLLSLRWKLATGDRGGEVRPQEFASATLWADTVYVCGQSGELFAVRATTGAERWRKRVGAVAAAPAVHRGTVFVGTMDGFLIALDAQTGEERWRYLSRGPISEPPVIAGAVVVFSNEADQVYGLDARTGAYRWQYKGETPEEYTLRGHAGVAVSGDLVFTGFSNGSMVALRLENGSVAWSTSLKGDADKFVDVDATPVVIDSTLYVTSSSGGLYALDSTTGLVRWRAPILDAAAPGTTGTTGSLAADTERIYVAAADLGIYAFDHAGNVLWRQGTGGGGEPATPVITGDLLIYTLAVDGMFLADRRTGEVHEWFNPGEGVSATPTAVDGVALYVMSNRGILYAFDLDTPYRE